MQAIILAAGKSSRLWPLNDSHKSLLRIMGKPIISYAVDGLLSAGIKDIIIVEDEKKQISEELKKYSRYKNIKYAVQNQALGMGDALLMVKDLLDDQFLVISPERIDCEEIVKQILVKAKEKKTKTILAASKTGSPSLFGIMKLEGDKILGIVEKPKAGEEPSSIKVVGVYLLEKKLFNCFKNVKKHQYDFEKVLSLYMQKNETRMMLLDKEGPSLKYPWQLFDLQAYLFEKYLKTETGSLAKIGKNVNIQGKVFIGKNVKIFENAVIKGPVYIGDNVIIGNGSIIRDNADIENNSLIGALAEVARSNFQENVHIHSGYFGDSVFGKNCKVGAGTVTANIRVDRGEIFSVVNGSKENTKKKSLGCFVGENTKIGVNCSLMPGILIGSNCLIGPKTLVSENIENNTKYYAAFEKIVKKNN